MTEEPSGGGLHIDSDWKTDAAEEKKRLAQQEAEAKAKAAADSGTGAAGQVNFFELVNVLAMQAAVGLSGMAEPNGVKVPPNPAMAQHFIELLGVLAAKTEGNLSPEEKTLLGGVQDELRGHYVQLVTAGLPTPDAQPGQAPTV